MRYAVERLESRTLLSVTAVAVEASYNTAGTTRTYEETLNGTDEGPLTQTDVGQSMFQGISCIERDSGIPGQFLSKAYCGFDSSGDFVEYGSMDVLANSTQTTVFSPPRLTAEASMDANHSVTSNYTTTVTDTNPSGVVTSTDNSAGREVITLKSDTTVPMTVGSDTYQTYDFTDRFHQRLKERVGQLHRCRQRRRHVVPVEHIS